jgi:hypothetical protein
LKGLVDELGPLARVGTVAEAVKWRRGDGGRSVYGDGTDRKRLWQRACEESAGD